MKKQVKKVLSFMIMGSIILNVLTPQNIFASNGDNVTDDSFENDVMNTDISLSDKKMILADDTFKEEYDTLTKDGWILQDIDVEDYSDRSTGGIQTYGTVTTSQGKVVTSSFVQPTKTQKKFNNKIYKKASDIKKMVAFGSNFIPGKWTWIASTLFGIDTSQYDVWFNNGYQKIEENATFYTKDAYYKEGNKYWVGYCTSKLKIAGTVISYYRDSKKSPHQSSKDYSKTFKTSSYDKTTAQLISLAKKYYKSGFEKEQIKASSNYRIY